MRAVATFGKSQPAGPRLVVELCAIGMLAVGSGCTRGTYPLGPGFPQGNPWGTQTQPAMPAYPDAQAQLSELQRRVELLDKDNRQLQTQLAQSEQQTQIYRDELKMMREELANTVEQLETARLAAERTRQQFQGLQASTRFRGGAAIEANTNVRQIAEAFSASGFPAVYEADAAKLIVPADQLFAPGTAQLLPQAANMLTPLAAQISRIAPRQRVNVESYWDDAPLTGGEFVNVHQLTSAQAGAVAQLLIQQGGLPKEQIGTAGYGATRPRQSNQTAAGRAANRRIEIVILPDTL